MVTLASSQRQLCLKAHGNDDFPGLTWNWFLTPCFEVPSIDSSLYLQSVNVTLTRFALTTTCNLECWACLTSYRHRHSSSSVEASLKADNLYGQCEEVLA